MTLDEINNLDIVHYLASIGIHHTKMEGGKFLYISPLRTPPEKNPSFKVNRDRNVWWDFGNPGGFLLVDFIMRYYGLKDTNEVLQKFNNLGSLQPAVPQHKPPSSPSQGKKVEIIEVLPIRSFYLERYLFERRISLDVARHYNQEVRYRFTGGDKEYYALGLKNDAGGYELRNKYHKYSADPKAPSTIINGSQDVALFEGNFNMLTLATFLHKPFDELPDFHVTNSSGNLEASLAKLDHYRNKYIFFDNDPTGDKLTARALAHDPNSYVDLRGMYKNYNDLNDWVLSKSKIDVPAFQQTSTVGRQNPLDDDSMGLRPPRPGR